MPKLTINGREIEVPGGITVLQACELAGAEIPRFCYHERLSVAGNCRMCLVEMERAPKPIASCAMPVADGMVISTDSEKVRKARNGVMEFLLINHPLDCPICDQGGECDLQDQSMAYGYDHSRYQENKRAVKEKYMGPLIKTIMTRCIQCTRCVRFATEIAGVEELGLLNRGEHAEITTLEKAIDSELSGNLVDICPVGALTSAPYAFAARPWELRKTPSVDVLDAVGSNIRVDARGRQVMRVLPRLHEDVNEEWINDKTRHACDGLARQRLDKPYLRGADGKLRPASWEEAFEAIAAKLEGLDPTRSAAIAGDLCDAESMLALKDFMGGLGSPNLDCRQDGAKVGGGPRSGYLFNTTIAGIEQADAVLIVGSDPRHEAALVNARLRKRFLATGLPVGVIGAPVELTFETRHLGSGPETLKELAAGKGAFAEILEKAERPMLILGSGAVARADGAAVHALCLAIAERYGLAGDKAPEGWNGFNLLQRAASRVGGLELGFLPGEGGLDTEAILEAASQGAIEFVWLLGADELDMARLGSAFVVYQGHHGDAGAHRADVILPGAAYTEKNATYVNTEGRVQLGRLAVFPPGEAREDWTILRALSERVGQRLPYDNLGELRRRLIETAPVFAALDRVEPAPWQGPAAGAGDAVSDAPFGLPVENFYMTDPISRASSTMAKCTEAFVLPKRAATGTDG
ncbi:NADH dehydrogenase subunit G [Tistlia consotensis]|uniref:NADH-quinone oxidoreductase n=1 Tax=Tistlia consotensis USBA 355 TaxID=560819 RepID=A0A1Y6BRC9_9PROT|nr:NADH-quinone oxidoreductase subunit NuoG [Tistlia consotensis]SMF25089.1 NADH dehydrogenase subunit G [Tistlia consotensis USBA 355]SNR60053.1 NADH dehydrogenase subunit G [Tistlia consotensis]